MKKLWLAVITLCAATAFAGTASIVSSFKSPCSTPCGIDYHGGYIYHGDGQDYIYRTTTTGTLLDSLSVGNASAGIDRMNYEFWTCNPSGWIFRLSTTGSMIRSFEGPASGYGITYGEECLWFTGEDRWLYKLKLNGSVAGSFTFFGRNPYGICYDDDELWVADQGNNAIFKATTTGSFVESFSISHYPQGVTWGGSYLWYTAAGWVYKTRVDFTAVAPASLGKVKALYR